MSEGLAEAINDKENAAMRKVSQRVVSEMFERNVADLLDLSRENTDVFGRLCDEFRSHASAAGLDILHLSDNELYQSVIRPMALKQLKDTTH